MAEKATTGVLSALYQFLENEKYSVSYFPNSGNLRISVQGVPVMSWKIAYSNVWSAGQKTWIFMLAPINDLLHKFK